MPWFVGTPHRILTEFDNLAHDNSEAEDISISILRFKPHILGQFTSSLLHHGEERAIIVPGDRGSVAPPWRICAYAPGENGFPAGDDERFIRELDDFRRGLPELEHEGHTGQVDDFLRAIETSSTPLVTGQDGKNAIEVVAGMYKSALEGRAVDLPLAGRGPLPHPRGLA
jgi:predicted dehydrogenase